LLLRFVGLRRTLMTEAEFSLKVEDED